MTNNPKLRTRLWFSGFALCLGLVLSMGLMPGMNFLIQADSQGSWTQAGFLDTPRTYRATATLLLNGDVLLAGGQAGQDGSGQGISNATRAAEIYNLSSGGFGSTGSMLIPRAGQTATLLEDGRVLLAGGIDHTWKYQSTTELYDPGSQVFTVSGSMMTGRAGHVAIRLPDGKVLMVGGHDGTKFLASAELFDPDTGDFTLTGSLHEARSNFSGVLFPSGKVLVLGGYGLPNGRFLDSAELYDPISGTFTPTGSLHTARVGFHFAVRLDTGDVLVAGGVGQDGQGLATAEIYSLQAESFSMTGLMQEGRQHHSLTVLPNGQVLVVGGWTGNQGTALKTVEIFHPDTGVFTESESLVTSRGFHTATLLSNGRVLIAGGSGEASHVSAALGSAELFFCSTCLAPPAAPTQVIAKDQVSDQGGAVLISWLSSPSPDIQEYRIYSSSTVGGPYSLIGAVPDASITSYLATGVVNGVVHYYVVRAFDGNQESGDSNEANTMALDNLPPNSPSTLIVEDVSLDDGTALSLSWTSSSSNDVVEQRLYRGLNPGGPYELIATLSGNGSSSFLEHGLVANVSYFYVLTAFDGTQESSFTPEAEGQPQDNRPVAHALQLTLHEDATGTTILAGEDLEGGSLFTYTIMTVPAHGLLTGQPPQLTYVPMPDFNGMDSFSYVVSKGGLASLPATVAVTVLAVNDPPTAINDVFTVEEDAIEARLGVLDNDIMTPDTGETLIVTGVSVKPQQGIVKVAPDQRSLLYTPPSNFHGIVSMNYTMTDGVFTREALVTVTVASVNDAPTVTPFVLSWVPSSSSKALEQRVYRSLNSGGPYQLIALLKDPAANYFVDTNALELGVAYYYVVRAFDGTHESFDSNEIHGVSGQRTVLVQEDSSASVMLPGYDLDGDSLSYVILQQPQHGTITGVGPSILYTPDKNFFGEDTLLFAVSDGGLLSATGTITFIVSGINDAPVAHALELELPEDEAASFSLFGEDPDGDSLSFVISAPPAHGQLSGDLPHLTYRPTPNFFGLDSFRYLVSDGVLTSEPAVVNVVVLPTNDPPVAVDDVFLVKEDADEISIDVVLNDTSAPDVEERLTITGASAPNQDGGVTVDPANQRLLYTPAANFSGTEIFTYTITDGSPNSEATASVTVTVMPVNDAPNAYSQTLQVTQGSENPISLSADDGDPEIEQALVMIVDTLPDKGALSLSAGGEKIVATQLPLVLSTPTLYYQSPSDGEGTTIFSFHAQDNGGKEQGGLDISSQASVTLIISP
jgi:fibronectin type 3 domain-containing protein